MISKKAHKIFQALKDGGFENAEMYKITSSDENVWNIEGFSGKEYTITKVNTKIGYKFFCTCPQHMFRHKECKHIKFLRKYKRI